MNQIREQEDGHHRWRERLEKLEEDLNELLEFEAKTRRQEEIYLPAPREIPCAQKRKGTGVCSSSSQPCGCCKLPKNPPQTRCEDIPRFLKNINFNLAKGTEAINKIVNFATLSSVVTQSAICAPEISAAEKNNEIQFKSNIVSNEDVIAYKSWKKSVGSNNNIDGLFKELRDEKDKRQRVENQVKALKEDLKKCRSGAEQEYNEKIVQINQELIKATDALVESETKLKKTIHEFETQLLACNVKYEVILRDLKEERANRKNVELEKKEMQIMLEQKLVSYQDILQLKNKLQEQIEENRNIMNIARVDKDRLETKLEDLQRQLITKQKMADQCTVKIKQLIDLCEKLKDQLLACRQKYDVSQKLVQNKQIQIQEVVERSAEMEANVQSLQKQLNENRTKQNINKAKQKAEIQALENDVQNLKDRLFKLIEINKKQENLILSQNESIERKQQQIWLAFNEISRLHQHIQTFPPKQNETFQDFEKTVAQLRVQIESEKQSLLIKDKIIADQSESIDKQKKALNSCRQEVFDLQRVHVESQRELAIQKTVNEGLTAKLKQMQLRKEELKQQLQELETELEEFQWHSQSSWKDEQLLEKLEEQVLERQKEWEMQVEKLQRERDEATREARSSNQMLRQKTKEFEQELQLQRQAQSALENSVAAKESKLAECEQKIASLNEELQRRTSHFETTTANLIKASEIWKEAVMQIKSPPG